MRARERQPTAGATREGSAAFVREPLTRARRASYACARDESPTMSNPRRPPTSARHSFALAFDLAVRRDALQSLWVPLLMHAPWLLLQAIVPAPEDPGGFSARNLMLTSVALVGDFVVSLLVASMLRFRALSVYEQ